MPSVTASSVGGKADESLGQQLQALWPVSGKVSQSGGRLPSSFLRDRLLDCLAVSSVSVTWWYPVEHGRQVSEPSVLGSVVDTATQKSAG